MFILGIFLKFWKQIQKYFKKSLCDYVMVCIKNLSNLRIFQEVEIIIYLKILVTTA